MRRARVLGSGCWVLGAFRVRGAGFRVLCTLVVAVAAAAILVAQPLPSDQRTPKLLVLLVVDQFRADYIEKFHQQWTRGLRRLVEDGAWFRIAEYPYYNTVTCPGHSSISTGTIPSVHGVILNGWWDRDVKKMVTCTDDPSVHVVSYGRPVKAEGESIARLRVPTLADELRVQLSSVGARHRVFAQGALGGDPRRPPPGCGRVVRRQRILGDVDGFFGRAGAAGGGLRQNEIQSRRISTRPGIARGPGPSYLYEDPAIGISEIKGGMTPSFPHALKGASGTPDAVFYDRWQSSPYADEYLDQDDARCRRQAAAGEERRRDQPRRHQLLDARQGGPRLRSEQPRGPGRV